MCITINISCCACYMTVTGGGPRKTTHLSRGDCLSIKGSVYRHTQFEPLPPLRAPSGPFGPSNRLNSGSVHTKYQWGKRSPETYPFCYIHILPRPPIIFHFMSCIYEWQDCTFFRAFKGKSILALTYCMYNFVHTSTPPSPPTPQE